MENLKWFHGICQKSMFSLHIFSSVRLLIYFKRCYDIFYAKQENTKASKARISRVVSCELSLSYFETWKLNHLNLISGADQCHLKIDSARKWNKYPPMETLVQTTTEIETRQIYKQFQRIKQSPTAFKIITLMWITWPFQWNGRLWHYRYMVRHGFL